MFADAMAPSNPRPQFERLSDQEFISRKTAFMAFLESSVCNQNINILNYVLCVCF